MDSPPVTKTYNYDWFIPHVQHVKCCATRPSNYKWIVALNLNLVGKLVLHSYIISSGVFFPIKKSPNPPYFRTFSRPHQMTEVQSSTMLPQHHHHKWSAFFQTLLREKCVRSTQNRRTNPTNVQHFTFSCTGGVTFDLSTSIASSCPPSWCLNSFHRLQSHHRSDNAHSRRWSLDQSSQKAASYF